MTSAASGSPNDNLDFLFGQLIDTETVEEFNPLADRIMNVASRLDHMTKLNANNLLLQIKADRNIQTLKPEESDRGTNLHSVKTVARAIDDLHTQAMRSCSSTPHIEDLKRTIEARSKNLETLVNKVKDPKLKSIGTEFVQTAKQGPQLDSGSRAPSSGVVAPWDKAGYLTPQEAQVFDMATQGLSKDDINQMILGEGKSLSEILMKTSFPDREPTLVDVSARMNTLGTSLGFQPKSDGSETVSPGEQFQLTLANLSSKIENDASLDDARFDYFLESTPDVDRAEISGLPNRGTDCFLNSSLQLLAQDYADEFDPDKNPISAEFLSDSKREYFKDLRVTSDVANTAENNALIDPHLAPLRELQKEIHSVLLKINSGREVSKTDIQLLRQNLKSMEFINVKDDQQEDAGLLKTKILNEILGFSKNGNQEVTIAHEVTIRSEDAGYEEEVINQVDIPSGAHIYKEVSDGVYSYTSKEKSSTHTVSPRGGDWSPTGSENIVPVQDAVRYIQKADGSYFKVKPTVLHTKESVAEAGKVLSIQVGRGAPQSRLNDEVSVGIPPKITVGGKKYVLSGFLSHIGNSTESGHYVANRLLKDADGQARWALLNDRAAYTYGSSFDASEGERPSGVAFGGESLKPANLLALRSTNLQYVRVDP